MPPWLDLETSSAPNPLKGEPALNIAISPELVRTNAGVRKVTPIYQAWCHVLGKLPPINNIAKIEGETPPVSLSTLHDSVACFGGLQRPHDDEEKGESVLVYVLNPTISLEYAPSMVCMARTLKMPSNTVLTVQVRPNFTLQGVADHIHGLVTRIEPVLSKPENPSLPAKFDSRYGQRFW